MHHESHSDYKNACNEYQSMLNKVNLLLLKQHSHRVQKAEYQSQLQSVNTLITTIQLKCSSRELVSIECEWNYLREMIVRNKKDIQKLKSKIQPRENLLNEFEDLKVLQEKYLKLVSNEFQNSIQQKLSMMRGKVDELKKKIKEINKDILSLEQEHAQEMDEYSFSLKSLDVYRSKNIVLRQEIERLKAARKK